MCNISGKSNETSKPNCLQYYLRAKHLALKEDSFKRIKIVSTNAFWNYSSAKAVEASFEITYFNTLAEKPHNIGKTLIKPCMLTAASLVLKEATGELVKNSLSDYTKKTRIHEITQDIELKVLEK